MHVFNIVDLSNVDADSLDGLDGTSFLRSNAPDTAFGRITFNSGVEPIRLMGSGNGLQNVIFIPFLTQSGERQGYIGFPSSGNSNIIWRNDVSQQQLILEELGGPNGLKLFYSGSTQTVFHTGNDGSGSGMDADLLDGNHAAYFLNIGSSTQTKSGNLVIDGKLNVNDILEVLTSVSGGFASTIKNNDDGASSNGLLVEVKNNSGNNTVQRWRVNGVEVARVRADGRIGVGTTIPAHEMDIEGTLRANNVINSSDRRLKYDIKKYVAKRMELNFVSFKWKFNDIEQIGFIAQDVEKDFPEFVLTDDQGRKSIKTIELLTAKIAEMDDRIKYLESNTMLYLAKSFFKKLRNFIKK